MNLQRDGKRRSGRCKLIFLGAACLLWLASCSPDNQPLQPKASSEPTPPPALAGSGQTQAPNDIRAQIDAYLQNISFSGSILVARKGEVLYEAGYGMADREAKTPNSPETIFRIGSVTKQFTAMAILKLQQQGLLNVNDPLSKHVPQFTQNDKLTIHHMLTHSSGLARDYPYSEAGNNLESVVMKYIDRPLQFTPGSRFQYSNVGYVILGYIVEMLSGQSCGQYLQQHIFTPLNMKSSGFDEYQYVMGTNRAYGYVFNGSARNRFSGRDTEFNHGDGALYMTVRDILLWERALYGNRLLQPPASATASGESSAPVYWQPYTKGAFRENEAYGYGWVVESDDKKHVYHGGIVEGFASFILLGTRDETAVIALSNEDIRSKIEGIARRIEKLAFDSK